MPKVFIKTYGCQMNERDTEHVAQTFIRNGYTMTDNESEADVILINTCSVRDKAEQKALGKMGSMLHKLRAHKPHAVFGFMGCMAQSRGNELFKTTPGLDIVMGTQKYHHVFEQVDSILKKRMEFRMDDPALSLQGESVCDVDLEKDSQNTINEHLSPENTATAFVSIMQGCNMKCSYCIVPDTRGVERSRPQADIVEEIKNLVHQGIKEITLLGQIVNLYGRTEWEKIEGKSPFVQLLEAIHNIKGIERIRFTSPHPIGYRDDLIAAFTYLPKLASHIHFPMQSGSDHILKLMRRPYKNETFIEICEKMRAARPDLAITTDVIVGFPGETEEDYLATKTMMEKIRFDNAFIFRYSPRRGTIAAEMPGQLSEQIKEARNQDLLQTVNKIAMDINNKQIGTIQHVLIDGPSKTNKERFTGRSSQNKPIIINSNDPALIGSILPVRIMESTGFTLYGDIIPA